MQSGIFCVKKYFADVAERSKQQYKHDWPEENAKIAVRWLHVAIPPGEIFCLLGANGAGKTATMSILTGDIKPTFGEVYVAGYDVSGKITSDVEKARKNIG